jgi:two-component system response regulator HydG
MLRPRVLVVDDETPIQTLLCRWLAMWKYPAASVGSASAALEMMKKDPADIVICDISMPEKDGLWLTGQLTAGWPQVAVIMATGRADAEAVRESRKLGAVGYVTKPFDPYLFRQAVDTAAERLAERHVQA